MIKTKIIQKQQTQKMGVQRGKAPLAGVKGAAPLVGCGAKPRKFIVWQNTIHGGTNGNHS